MASRQRQSPEPHLYTQNAHACRFDRPSPETFKPLLKLLAVSPEKFTPADLENAIEHISHPQGTTDAQLGSWLTCIHFLGRERDPEFLAQYARLTRAKAVTVDLPNRTGAVVCDIVGTGGDGQDTFNASTAAAIVASGVPGMRVCKVCSSSVFINIVLTWETSTDLKHQRQNRVLQIS